MPWIQARTGFSCTSCYCQSKENPRAFLVTKIQRNGIKIVEGIKKITILFAFVKFCRKLKCTVELWSKNSKRQLWNVKTAQRFWKKSCKMQYLGGKHCDNLLENRVLSSKMHHNFSESYFPDKKLSYKGLKRQIMTRSNRYFPEMWKEATKILWTSMTQFERNIIKWM